jgi:hypothetical protein
MTRTAIPSAYRDAPQHVPNGVLAGDSVADVGDNEVVVFLIGARIHRWHRVRSWFPTFIAMPRMLIQLAMKPDLGLLHAKTYWAGRDIVVVQYWRSVDDLGRFAKDPSLAHAPAWAAFNREAAGTGDIGIWHETYRVPADGIETRYGNLAPFGLGKALGVRERFGAPRNSTHHEMNETDSDYIHI